MKLPVLVLGIHRRQSLGVIRSLGKAGYKVILGRFGNSSITERSRFVSQIIDFSPLNNKQPGEFIRILQGSFPTAGATNPVYIYPVSNDELTFFSRNWQSVPDGFRVAMPNPNAIETCLDKYRTNDLVRELNLPNAESQLAYNKTDIFRKANYIGFPLIIKPCIEGRSIQNRKAYICQNDNELQQGFADWNESDSVVIEKYITGKRHNVYFFANQGELIRSVQFKILRTDRVDDTGLAVEGISVPLNPDFRKICQKLIRRLDYSGAGCIQFLRDDASGKIHFLEMNARLGANFAVAMNLGLDLPRMQMELARGNSNFSDCLDSYPIGKRFSWLWGDIRGLKDSLKEGRISYPQAIQWLGKILSTNFRADFHVTWSSEDPAPTLALYWNKIFGQFTRRLCLRRKQDLKPLLDLS